MNSTPRIVPYLVVPAAIVLLGLLLRVQGIDSTSLWLDEAYSWEQAANSLWGMLNATRQDNYPPLHNFLLYLAINGFGDSELVLRMPSVILGTATIYLVYRLGRDMFGQSAGVIASLLIAVSVFHIWHSIETRMYALLAFTTVLYVWSVLHTHRTDATRAHVLCAICAVLMLYSHVFGLFNFLAVNLAVLLQAATERRLATPAVRKWLIWQGIAALLFLPWALLLLLRIPNAERSIGWIADPSVEHVTRVFVVLLSGPVMAWAIVLVTMAGVFAALFSPRPAPTPTRTDETVGDENFSLLLIFALIFVPFLIALAISLLFTSLMVSRYMIGGLPMFFILIGAGLTQAFRQPLLRAVAVICLMLPTVEHLGDITQTDWRKQMAPEFARFEELRQDGDTVAFVPFRDPTFQYYVRDREGLDLKVFEWLRGQEAPADMVALNRVWIFALLQHRNNILPLMDQLNAAGFVEEVSSGTDRWVFSLFTRPPSNATAP